MRQFSQVQRRKVAVAQLKHSRCKKKVSALRSYIAKVSQGQQTAPGNRSRQAGLGCNFRKGATGLFAVERAQYLQTTGQRLHVIRALGERNAVNHGGISMID